MTVQPMATPANESATQVEDGLGAVRRALSVLKFLAQTSPVGSRLTDIAAGTGLPPSTVHRLLRGLVDEGMALRETGAGHLYKLGPFALGLGPEASSHHFSWFSAICRPSLERLASATGQTAQLTARIGRSGLSLDIVHGKEPSHPAVAKSGAVGFIGFGSTSVVLLAALPDPQIDEILWDNEWHLSQSGIAPEQLRRMIEAARRRGYCYSEQEFVPGLCAISVTIPSERGLPYAALTVLAGAERVEQDRIEFILSHLQREAHAIARRVDRTSGSAHL